ncbi:MAG: hypothetical protein ACLQBD_01280 [Syntrophobacteraceae bacterium]
MDKKEQHLKDLEFICAELIRFARMSFQELKAHFESNKADGLCTIPHPDGRGELICGCQAYDKFLQIAQRHLAGFPDLQKQIQTEELKRALIHDFVNRFLKRHAEIDSQSVNKMLAAALKHVKQKRKDLTHYIPCIICEEQSPDEFHVGPVCFSLMRRFLSKASGEFESERQRIYSEHRVTCQKAIDDGMPEERVATPEGSRRIADGLVDGVLTYFSDFPWVAEVSIPQCSEKVSRMRAELAVEGALNVLRVLIGEYHTKKMIQGAPPASRFRAGSLTKDNSSSRFDFSTSSGVKGAFLGEDWFNKLSKAAGYLLFAMSSALIGLIDPFRCSHLRQRFLDALTWYGQGVTEMVPSAKIIKYVAALERIVVTGSDDIAKTVAERVALLCCELDPMKYEEWKEDTAKTYNFRSRLMHGDYSPMSEELVGVSALAERIARLTLQNAIIFYISIEQKIPGATAKRLEEEFFALRGTLPRPTHFPPQFTSG